MSQLEPLILTEEAAEGQSAVDLTPITTVDGATMPVVADRRLAELLPHLAAAANTSNPKAAVKRKLAALFGKEEAAAINVVTEGEHKVDAGTHVVLGGKLTANGDGVVLAVGGRVIARGKFDVYAAGETRLCLYDEVQAFVIGKAHVERCVGNVRGFAAQNATGVVGDHSAWVLRGNAAFDLYDVSTADADGNGYSLRAYNEARLSCRGTGNVWMTDRAQGWLDENVRGELNERAFVYARRPANMRIIGAHVRVGALPQGRMNILDRLGFLIRVRES